MREKPSGESAPVRGVVWERASEVGQGPGAWERDSDGEREKVGSGADTASQRGIRTEEASDEHAWNFPLLSRAFVPLGKMVDERAECGTGDQPFGRPARL